MRVFKTAFEAGKEMTGSVVAIGKFDALHLGHRKLIDAALARAGGLGAPLLVLTFDPSPEQFLRSSTFRPVLPLARRIEILREWGVDGVALLPFDEHLACVAPEAFAKNVLALQVKPRCVFVGEDFCFGKDAAGRVSDLERWGPALGFTVHPIPLALADGEKVSASRIRRLLDQGDKAAAEKLLGRKL